MCFFYHFLVSPQVMYHGGCILFARHSFTAAPPILSPIPHKSPLRLCASSGAVWLAFDWLVPPSSSPHFPPRSHPVDFGLQIPFPNFNTPSPSAGNVAYTDNLAAESSASLSPPPRTHSHTGTHSAFTAKGACFPRRLLLELCVKSASSLLPRGGPARAPSLSTPCWIAGSRAAPTVPGEGGGRERGWGAGRKRWRRSTFWLRAHDLLSVWGPL